MYYVTTVLSKKPVQLTWEDVMFDKVPLNALQMNESNGTSTITRKYETISPEILEQADVEKIINWLKLYNLRYKELFEKDRKTLYRSFKIPKATGGYRDINAPCDELQDALRVLVRFLSEDCGILYHTAAFAYIKGRSIVDCVKRHQNFNSNWFLKTDFSGFFPSTTIEFVMKMYSMIFPLSEVCKNEEGYAELKKALSLAFLDGGLPQGTCASPFITNSMMIPIDHKLSNEFAKRNLMYTRYADDIHISAKECFPWKEIVKNIEDTLTEFEAPFKIKPEKTHFGKKAGRSANWCLGLLLNKDNNITVSAKKKAQFKASLCSFILDTRNGKYWNIEDVYHLRGLLSYYSMVEKEYFENVIKQQENKWKVNVSKMFKDYLSGTINA